MLQDQTDYYLSAIAFADEYDAAYGYLDHEAYLLPFVGKYQKYYGKPYEALSITPHFQARCASIFFASYHKELIAHLVACELGDTGSLKFALAYYAQQGKELYLERLNHSVDTHEDYYRGLNLSSHEEVDSYFHADCFLYLIQYRLADKAPISHKQLCIANRLALGLQYNWAISQDFLELYQGPISPEALALATVMMPLYYGSKEKLQFLRLPNQDDLSYRSDNALMNWSISIDGKVSLFINRYIDTHYEEIIMTEWKDTSLLWIYIDESCVQMSEIFLFHTISSALLGKDTWDMITELFHIYDSFVSVGKVEAFLNAHHIPLDIQTNHYDYRSVIRLQHLVPKGQYVESATALYTTDSHVQVKVVIDEYGVSIYHNKNKVREIHMSSLGLPAVIH